MIKTMSDDQSLVLEHNSRVGVPSGTELLLLQAEDANA